jgi:predicted HAD superfamily Cof-like phosphohydrolase
MKKEETSFFLDAKKFNEIYKLPINNKPTLLGVERLENFKSILLEEISEIDEIIKKYKKKPEEDLEILTDLSDWLGDIVVFVGTECIKHGIDLNKTLKIIMQSNFSKLGADGKPIYDERGKVMKGPNYWKPEPKIRELLKESLSSE